MKLGRERVFFLRFLLAVVPRESWSFQLDVMKLNGYNYIIVIFRDFLQVSLQANTRVRF